jgi:hypothetical protein
MGVLEDKERLNMSNKEDILMNIATDLNTYLEADILDVPIIDHFKVQEGFSPNIMFVAVSDDDYIEQLVFDSVLPTDISVEEKINQVIADTINEMKNNGLINPEDNLYFYKDHKSLFDYKIYIQNFVKDIEDSTILIKQFNVYFIEPNTRNFYQLSLSSGPVDYNTVDQKELEKQLYFILEKILDDISYSEV